MNDGMPTTGVICSKCNRPHDYGDGHSDECRADRKNKLIFALEDEMDDIFGRNVNLMDVYGKACAFIAADRADMETETEYLELEHCLEEIRKHGLGTLPPGEE